MGRKIIILTAVLFTVFVLPKKGEAFIFISEILADPAKGIEGDSNRDGLSSTSQDEFIELLNYSEDTIDLSGWSISDAIKTRHIFSADTLILPYEYLVVFSGGVPTFSDVKWQIASEGSLSLNNKGDEISLYNFDGVLIDKVIYGSEGGKDQSIVLFGYDEDPQWLLHSSVEEAEGKLFSPGYYITGELFEIQQGEEDLPDKGENKDASTVPELPVFLYFSLGGIALYIRSWFR